VGKNVEVVMSVARKKLQKIGNSTGVVLPAELLREAGLQPGDEVVLQAERGRLVITVIDPDFDDLVAAADRFVSDHPNALRKLAE
jgi:putative addiction module antidote